MCSIIREKILNYTGREKVPMVLVGNKSDLAVQRYVSPCLSGHRSHRRLHSNSVPEPSESNDYRQVTKEEGAALAANWGLTSFVETSARTGENVNRVFDLIVAQIESELNPHPEEKQSGGCVIT